MLSRPIRKVDSYVVFRSRLTPLPCHKGHGQQALELTAAPQPLQVHVILLLTGIFVDAVLDLQLSATFLALVVIHRHLNQLPGERVSMPVSLQQLKRK